MAEELDKKIDALIHEIADELHELKATEKRYLRRVLDGLTNAGLSYLFVRESCAPDDIANIGRHLQSAKDWLEEAAWSGETGETVEEQERRYRRLLEKFDDLERLMREAIREICSCRPFKSRK